MSYCDSVSARARRIASPSSLLVPSCVALLSLAALCLATAPALAHPRTLTGCGALLACAVVLSIAETRRYYRRKLRAMRTHPSRYAAEFLTLADNSRDAVLLLEAERDADGRITDFAFRFLNVRARQMLCDGCKPVTGARLAEAMPVLAGGNFAKAFQNAVEHNSVETGEFAVPDGQMRSKWLRFSATRFEDGVLLTATDMTAEKQLEAGLCHKAHYDTLTGLPNRLLLDDRLGQAFDRARRHQTAAAVLMLDIDHLRLINEAHGRDAGDHVLRTASARLCAAVRATDSVFRLGDDEFVVLLTDVAEKASVTSFAEKIAASLAMPVPWKGHQLAVHSSIGVATYPEAATTPETLLVQADVDLFRRKRLRPARGVTSASAAPALADIANFAYGLR